VVGWAKENTKRFGLLRQDTPTWNTCMEKENSRVGAYHFGFFSETESHRPKHFQDTGVKTHQL